MKKLDMLFHALVVVCLALSVYFGDAFAAACWAFALGCRATSLLHEREARRKAASRVNVKPAGPLHKEVL